MNKKMGIITGLSINKFKGVHKGGWGLTPLELDILQKIQHLRKGD